MQYLTTESGHRPLCLRRSNKKMTAANAIVTQCERISITPAFMPDQQCFLVHQT